MRVDRRSVMLGAAAAVAVAPSVATAKAVEAVNWRVLAREAYVYGFPLVDNYRVLHSYFVDRGGREYKGPWNQVHSVGRVFTPDDQAIQSPNSDTPYSMLGADLRAEPLVLTLPPVPDGRYVSAQFVDLYTHNFAYAGTRTDGGRGGRYLLAGPGWSGARPTGVDAVFRCETELAFVLYRTQLYGPGDIENVRRIQASYQVQPLSAFIGRPTPDPAPAIDFPPPLTPEGERSSLQVFELMNFVLRYCPPHPSERALMRRLGAMDIGPGRRFEAASFSGPARAAMSFGVADAWTECDGVLSQVQARQLGVGALFGTRAFLGNNYLRRMAGAAGGIYGNSREEAWYQSYRTDTKGRPLNGAQNRYRLRFTPGELPPVDAFWSLTLYQLPGRTLYANALDRYLINSPMLKDLTFDPDGGLTLHLQHEPPAPDRRSNWLPAPPGPFLAALRLYLPEPQVETGQWTCPWIERSDLVES